MLHKAVGLGYMLSHLTCGRGGIGRRAALRSLFLNRSGSSSLLGRTIKFTKPIDFIEIKIKKMWNSIFIGIFRSGIQNGVGGRPRTMLPNYLVRHDVRLTRQYLS